MSAGNPRPVVSPPLQNDRATLFNQLEQPHQRPRRTVSGLVRSLGALGLDALRAHSYIALDESHQKASVRVEFGDLLGLRAELRGVSGACYGDTKRPSGSQDLRGPARFLE